jgi:hypothetical protein
MKDKIKSEIEAHTEFQESVLGKAVKEKEKEKESKPKSRDATATRLPADWKPDGAEIAFCKSKRPDLNPECVADRFRDYWLAQPGINGRKTDWKATWRNWVRSERVNQQESHNPQNSNAYLFKGNVV